MAVRSENDYYPTPDALAKHMASLLTRATASVDFKPSQVCEPCRGEAQAIFKYLPEGCQWAELTEGKDYLNTKFEGVKYIVTNPPFNIAMDFVQKGLQEVGKDGTAIYLLRLNWLGSQKRHQFLKDNPPTHLFVLSPRPSFTGKGTDSTEYALICWDYGGNLVESPGIHFWKWK